MGAITRPAVGDRETVTLARDFRRQQERMAGFLLKLIPRLAKAAAIEEIPRAERVPAARPPRARGDGAAVVRRRTGATARPRVRAS